MADRRCKATTKKGARCRAAPLTGSDHCLAHAPRNARESRGFGGAQPGSGRPRKPRAIDALTERVEADIDAWLAPLIEAREATKAVIVGHGEGAHVEMVPDHAIRIRAVAEVFDRVYGRPRQQLEHTGADGGPLAIDADLADPKVREGLHEVLRRVSASRG